MYIITEAHRENLVKAFRVKSEQTLQNEMHTDTNREGKSEINFCALCMVHTVIDGVSLLLLLLGIRFQRYCQLWSHCIATKCAKRGIFQGF